MAYGTATQQAWSGITNLSFTFIHSDGTRSSFNLTNGSTNGSNDAGSSASINTTLWNISLDSTNLKDGNYSIVVNASNFTGGTFTAYNALGSGIGNRSANNLAFAITIDNTPPALHFLVANISNRTNITSSNSGNFSDYIQINVSANDTTTWTQSVKVELRNATGAAGGAAGLNYSIARAGSFAVFSAGISFNNLSDDEYQVYLYINDSLNNTNASLATNFSFRVDRRAPIINNFSLVYLDRSIVFNLSNISNSTPQFILNFTDNLSISANCSVFVNWTTNGAGTPEHARAGNLTASNGAVPNSTSTNITSTGTVPDGSHIAYAVCTDGSGNQGNSTNQTGAPTIGVGTLHFRVDTTSPNLSAETFIFGNYSGYAGHDGRYVGVNLSAGLSEGNFTLQVLINDSTSSVQLVRFNVSNSSGQVVPFNYTAFRNHSLFRTGSNASAFNESMVPLSVNNTHTLGPFNLSRLAEGWYNLTVWTNDSVNNINGSLRMTFVIDRTKPSVSVTCSPASPTAGDTVTCTCTGSDAYPGSGLSGSVSFTGGGTEESTTATGSGTFTSSTCTGTDYAGNQRTATGSWTVTAASSGGSGSGGSGGGVSSGVTGTFSQETWTSINSGETATLEVKKGEIGVTEVTFKVDETVYGAWVKVVKKTSLPSQVSTFEGKTYKIVEITKGTSLKDNLLSNIELKFEVLKSWLTENNLGKNQVIIYRFVNDEWTELTTTAGEDDGTYVHYTAETPGFSYFVIGEKGFGIAAPPAAEAPEAPAAQEEVAEAPAAAEAPTAEELMEAPGATWPWVVVVLVLAAIGVAWYFLKKKK